MGRVTAKYFEVSFSCLNLSKEAAVYPMLVLLTQAPQFGQCVWIGRTEVMHNAKNPRFAQRIIVPLSAEELRICLFKVIDFERIEKLEKQKYLAQAECCFSDLIEEGHVDLNFTNGAGALLLNCSPHSVNNDGLVQLYLTGMEVESGLGSRVCFLEFERARSFGSLSGLLVYRTQPCHRGRFRPIEASIHSMALGDWRQRIQVLCWRWRPLGDHEMIGSCDTSLMDMLRAFDSEVTPSLCFRQNGETRARARLTYVSVLEEFRTAVRVPDADIRPWDVQEQQSAVHEERWILR